MVERWWLEYMVQSADSADWPCVGEGAVGGRDVPELPEAAAAEEMMGAEGGSVHILRPALERAALSIQAEIMRIGEECRLHNLSPDLLRQQRAWRKRRTETSQ